MNHKLLSIQLTLLMSKLDMVKLERTNPQTKYSSCPTQIEIKLLVTTSELIP